MTTLTGIKPLQLSEFTEQISEAIADAFGGSSNWVIADVSNHTFQPGYSRHFLDLVQKDDDGKNILAKVSAVAWSSGATRIHHFEKVTGQKFKTGIKVCVRVQVDFHPSYGLKLVILDIDPSFTIGQLELHRQATIQRLLRECASFIRLDGERFRSANHGLNHATVIQRIAVLSSSSSAGLQDFRHALLTNRHGYTFTLNYYYTAVQGEANAEAAVEKIDEICATKVPYDAVVIIRGGGADTDFLLFDQFQLCSAVARLQIPVITGIGHLKNQSLVDLLAHTSTNTPTKAAEFILAHNLAFETLLLSEQKRIIIRSQQIISRQNERLLSLRSQIGSKARALLTRQHKRQEGLREQILSAAKTKVNRQKLLLSEMAGKTTSGATLLLSRKKGELDHTRQSIKTSVKNYYGQQRHSIERIEIVCRLMSPVNLLKKGFAMIYHQGAVITAGKALQKGDELTIRLQDTELTTTITDKKDNYADSFEL
ncbi:exodeoxyribonuclease VII large subunit [Flavisolibacter sp. BT320]|nr:exodeoxyribonuclease VII large subunit [Flavisolibacter longurius]